MSRLARISSYTVFPQSGAPETSYGDRHMSVRERERENAVSQVAEVAHSIIILVVRLSMIC